MLQSLSRCYAVPLYNKKKGGGGGGGGVSGDVLRLQSKKSRDGTHVLPYDFSSFQVSIWLNPKSRYGWIRSLDKAEYETKVNQADFIFQDVVKFTRKKRFGFHVPQNYEGNRLPPPPISFPCFPWISRFTLESFTVC